MSRPPRPLEVRRNEDGSLDEIVCDGASIHLEQMNTNHWWMAIETDSGTVHLNFSAKGKITARCETYPEAYPVANRSLIPALPRGVISADRRVGDHVAGPIQAEIADVDQSGTIAAVMARLEFAELRITALETTLALIGAAITTGAPKPNDPEITAAPAADTPSDDEG